MRCAKSWNANQRAWSCITILGRPVVPDVELRNHRSSRADRLLGARLAAAAARP